jgi:hypothetical protein
MRKKNSWGKAVTAFVTASLLGLTILGCTQVIDSTSDTGSLVGRASRQTGSLEVVNLSDRTAISAIKVTPSKGETPTGTSPQIVQWEIKAGGDFWSNWIRRGEYLIEVRNGSIDEWSAPKYIDTREGQQVTIRYDWDITPGGSWEESESDGGTLRIINRSGEDLREVQVKKTSEADYYSLYDSSIIDSAGRAFTLEKAVYNVKIVKDSGILEITEPIELVRDGVKKDVTILVGPDGRYTIIKNEDIVDPDRKGVIPGNNGELLWIYNGSTRNIIGVKIHGPKVDGAFPPDPKILVPNGKVTIIEPGKARAFSVAPGTYQVYVQHEGEDYTGPVEVTVGKDKDGLVVDTDNGLYAVDPNDLWGSDTSAENPTGNPSSIPPGYGLLRILNKTTNPAAPVLSVSVFFDETGVWTRISNSGIDADSFRNFYLQEGSWTVKVTLGDGAPPDRQVTITRDKYVTLTVTGKDANGAYNIDQSENFFGGDNIALFIKNMAETDNLTITAVKVADETSRIVMENMDGLHVGKEGVYEWPGLLKAGIYKISVKVNNKGYTENQTLTLKVKDTKTLEFFLVEEPPAPGQTDKDGLNASIKEAETLLNQTARSGDGTDIALGEKWVPQDVYDRLVDALREAEIVKADTDASQEDVDLAKANLDAKIEEFNSQREDGTRPANLVDKSALITAIAQARADRQDVTVSTDGTDVPGDKKWVSQAVWDVLDTALTNAQGQVDKANATQSDVDNAKSALDSALANFNSGKQAGSYTPPSGSADKSALIAAIITANSAKDGVTVSADNGFTVPGGSVWVSQAVLDTFNNAITTAIGVKDNASATQGEVDGAVATLLNAISVFNTAKTTASPNKAPLIAAIAGANAAKQGVIISETGAGVVVGQKWVPQAAMTALNNAIAAAQAVVNDPAKSQKEVDDATAALNTAFTTFNGVLTNGTLSTRLTVKNIDHTKDQLRYLNLYPTTGGATRYVITTSNLVPLNQVRSFDNIPEGTYRMRYRCASSGTVLYPDEPGIIISLKAGYETYIELPGDGEIPKAAINPLGGSSMAGTGAVRVKNPYSKNMDVQLFNQAKSTLGFSHQISGALKLSATSTSPNYSFVAGKSATSSWLSVTPGVYWIKGKFTSTWYGWNSSRWQPVFVFPGQNVEVTADSSGLKQVKVVY